MKKTNKKRKQLDKAISQDFMNPETEKSDMTPVMESVYFWGLRNIPEREIDRILSNNKQKQQRK
jgi:hypothetical protein|tara:strand:- start:1450 stop:1641 length:192 start_codon:yes stop_codon:yes gene_type:complete